MKKLAFIDHSFKKQSLSSSFLIDRLKEEYNVEIFWDESCSGGPRVDLSLISEGNFDVLVLFQQMNYYSIKDLKSLGCTVILVPMYDAEHRRPDYSWYQFRHFKFINFSKTIHQRLLDIGIESFYCQYFPPIPPMGLPQKTDQAPSQLKGFFWQRRSEITWNEIKQLIGQANFAKIHIHTAVDPPGFELVLPSDEDHKRYKITTSTWFASKDEYMSTVAEVQVYFAPRLYEGIGMAFLEAMAMGKCVVAPNHPTMNEYITHGYNGLLYNPENPQPLDFSNVKAICLNAQKYISEGFVHWTEEQQNLISFIAESKRRTFHSLPVLKKRLKLLLESKKQHRK